MPIRGEAGMGYILEKGFDLPPLMLTPDEIEAAVLGAPWVVGHADPVRTFVDEDLWCFDEVWAAAGTPHDVFAITAEELLRASGGERAAVKAG